MRFLITGATGFIGRHLCAALAAQGHERVVLARDVERAAKIVPGARIFAWNGKVGLPPEAAFEGVDVVVNLIGESVAERWTEKRKLSMRDSRVLPTRALVERMEALSARPSALLSMSGVGIYGDRGDEVVTETSRLGNTDNFLVRLAGEWEAAARGAEALGVRVVLLRSGLVLGDGGALSKMLLPFRMGLGASLGTGQQYFPWVHIDDAVGIILHAAQTPALVGPVNVVGPEPVTNQEFTDALAKAVRSVGRLRVPTFALKAVLGEMAGEVLLSGQKVSPGRALGTNFTFRYPLVADALRAILPTASDKMKKAAAAESPPA